MRDIYGRKNPANYSRNAWTDFARQYGNLRSAAYAWRAMKDAEEERERAAWQPIKADRYIPPQ